MDAPDTRCDSLTRVRCQLRLWLESLPATQYIDQIVNILGPLGCSLLDTINWTAPVVDGDLVDIDFRSLAITLAYYRLRIQEVRRQ